MTLLTEKLNKVNDAIEFILEDEAITIKAHGLLVIASNLIFEAEELLNEVNN